jgi:hypothetical protein
MKAVCAAGLVLVLLGLGLVIYEGAVVPNRSGRPIASQKLTLTAAKGGPAPRAEAVIGPLELKTDQNPFRFLVEAVGDRSEALGIPANAICDYTAAVRTEGGRLVWEASGRLHDTANRRGARASTAEALGVFEVPEDTTCYAALSTGITGDCSTVETTFTVRRNVRAVNKTILFAGVGAFLLGVVLLAIGKPREAEIEQDEAMNEEAPAGLP